MRIGVLLGALILVAAGCSSTHHDPAGAARLVPWDGAVPAQLRVAASAPAPRCQASQLRVVGDGFDFSAALSGGTGEATVRNAGTGTCQLTGRPDVQIVGAVPAPRQRQDPLPAQPPAFPTVAPPDTVLATLPPGAAATLDIDWRNWCVPRASGTPVPPRTIRLTLPGGTGSLDVGYNALPGCDTPGAASTIGVHPFQPAPLASTAPWTSTALRAAIAPLPGARQLRGARGDTVRFAVELRNPSAAPISFDRCPLIVEMLAPAGHPEVHQLNCRAAVCLPATGSLRFEMRIQIPPNAPVGSNGLFWELDPTGGQAPETVSRIMVTDHAAP
ncbi:DUF4232 domain-containing protein [Rugosimonospora africana]|uniref:DUF4232 domain-containing protein n=1 Tax=Rugosimonospora africana TaxID=556532 RepID=A0A8J3QVH3_9ACTN|nr:DUF4232 domain-containing protein [Rugosimonospora africana]GIH17159.1 hypothetical protein Raf01_53310 [Rugosimonospora africana]